MLVTPVPGANHDTVLRVLREVWTDAMNARGTTGDWNVRWKRYLVWASDAARRLTGQIQVEDIDRLVLTPRYWTLQSVTNAVTLDALMSLEMDERVGALERALRTFEHQINRWSPLRNLGQFVVADSSVYIQHPEKIEDLDLTALLDLGDLPIHLLVPITVVDELDGLKQSRTAHARWRAGYTLAVIDRVLPDPREIGQLRPQHIGAHGAPRGGTTIELVLDPPGHVRLPIDDDEIVDRAVAIQSLAGGPITFVTCDTGQSMRARAAGLHVFKILQPPEGDEPDANPQKANAKRQAGTAEPKA